MSTSTRLITYEESLTMPESNLEEVIDGELLTMPPATKHHGSLVRELQRQFDRQMSSDLDLTQGVGFLLQRSPPSLSHARARDSESRGLEKRSADHG